MEEATYAAALAVLGESAWRFSRCNPFSNIKGSFKPSFLFAGAYILCIAVIYLDAKNSQLFQSPHLRLLLKILHAADGVISLILGLGIYYQQQWIMGVGIIAISKFFLLSWLSRMVTGVAGTTKLSHSIQTTKTFLHHVGSFFFISEPRVAVITAIWRFVSMNGHAVLTLRENVDKATYDGMIWTITHARNMVIIFILFLCIWNDDIRRGFAVSAVGHIAYMLTRLGPVFRLGSLYLEEGDEKNHWQKSLTDGQRLMILMSGKFPFFILELGLMAIAVAYFAYLRATTNAFLADECTFI